MTKWYLIPLLSLSACADEWKNEGTIPPLEFYAEPAIDSENKSSPPILSTKAAAFVSSTYVLYVYEPTGKDAYPIGFDYNNLCKDFLENKEPLATAAEMLPPTEEDKKTKLNIYGKIDSAAWIHTSTGKPIGWITGSGLLFCATTNRESRDATIIGVPLWLQRYPDPKIFWLDRHQFK